MSNQLTQKQQELIEQKRIELHNCACTLARDYVIGTVFILPSIPRKEEFLGFSVNIVHGLQVKIIDNCLKAPTIITSIKINKAKDGSYSLMFQTPYEHAGIPLHLGLAQLLQDIEDKFPLEAFKVNDPAPKTFQNGTRYYQLTILLNNDWILNTISIDPTVDDLPLELALVQIGGRW